MDTFTSLDDSARARMQLCPDYGASAEWAANYQGQWTLMEPGFLPRSLVPLRLAWQRFDDGVVGMPLYWRRSSNMCIVPHFAVCPGRAAQLTSGDWLLLMREQLVNMPVTECSHCGIVSRCCARPNGWFNCCACDPTQFLEPWT